MSQTSAQRRLAAILVADVVGYSRLMEADETETLATLRERRKEIVEPLVRENGGRIVKFMGDGVLVEFGSAVNAVSCALDLQERMAKANEKLSDPRQIVLRIGINLGEVVDEGSDIFGDGVNIAARLEGHALPGGICISGKVHDEIRGKLDFSVEDLGEVALKNITRPVRSFRIILASGIDSPVKSSNTSDSKPSIAVLPFTNMSGEPDQEYFSDGITEDIITELSRFHEFAVIARNSSFSYKGLSPKIADVGRELGVKYVVEGSVRKIGNRVRVTVQLIDSTSAAHIWAERYDRSLDDIFAIQDEVTEAVVARIADGIKGVRALHARSRPSHSATAYDLVLQARPYRTSHTAAASEIAAMLLRQATELDPSFALAHASLAFVRTSQVEEGWSDDPNTALAEALAERNGRSHLIIRMATRTPVWPTCCCNSGSSSKLSMK